MPQNKGLVRNEQREGEGGEWGRWKKKEGHSFLRLRKGRGHKKLAVKRGRVMQIYGRDHIGVHPQKKIGKKNVGERGESSDQLSESESDS